MYFYNSSTLFEFVIYYIRETLENETLANLSNNHSLEIYAARDRVSVEE